MVKMNHCFDEFHVIMNETKKKSKETELDAIPLVTDFVKFYPWACYQFQLKSAVYVERVTPQGTISEKTTLPLKSPQIEMPATLKRLLHQSVLRLPTFTHEDEENTKEHSTDTTRQSNQHHQKAEKQIADVYIKALYNREHNLVELNFMKFCKLEAEKVIKILQYIIPYFPHLNSLIIKENINSLAVYEISKLMQISNITEVSLDGCTVKEGNYFLLLQEMNNLSNLSLARCTINDDVAIDIAVRLSYPQAASKTLHLLNLSSNMITDKGAKAFAETLRTNRKLYYLNLANNILTDDGVFALLDTFLEFSLSAKEREEFRKRHWDFVKTKNDLIQKFMTELKLEEGEDIRENTENTKKDASPNKKNSKAGKNLNTGEKVKKKVKTKTQIIQQINIEEKATAMADKILAEYEEPFENIYRKYDILQFSGNHTLRILNIAYNNITYLSLKKLLKVLEHQKLLNREPIGLLNVSIEGNYLPKSCVELQLIDEIFNGYVQGSVVKCVKKRNNNSARSSVTNTSK